MKEYAYEIQGFYTRTYGWEPVDTVSTRDEATKRLSEYTQNEKVPFRIKKVSNSNVRL